jgi:flavin reductase (DIM6/NTAB) family NADH-FMN oxidoreductase RutF
MRGNRTIAEGGDAVPTTLPAAGVHAQMLAVEPVNLRRCLSQFATGVTIITTVDEDGQPVGVTANSFNSVSLDPPVILWSLRLESFSMPAFRHSGAFAVNILTGEQRELSARFAKPTPNKWQGVDFVRLATGVPALGSCLAVLDCRTIGEHVVGDHVILLGQVHQLHVRDSADPLVFYRGQYRALAASQ